MRVRNDASRPLDLSVPALAGILSDASAEPKHDGARAVAARGGATHWSMVLESDPTRLAEARALVEEVADVIGMGPRCRYQLKVAVHEAVMNAMQHGAAFGAPVRLAVRLDADHVTFIVADPGPLFTVACPSQPDLRDHGRGLTLMVRCVDDLAVHALPVGKELHLTKRLGDARHIAA